MAMILRSLLLLSLLIACISITDIISGICRRALRPGRCAGGGAAYIYIYIYVYV